MQPGSPHDWPQPFASECSIRQGVLAGARPNSISTLALMSVRRSTNSSREPRATLPTRWRVRPTMLSDLPRPSTAVELSQVGRIPMQTAGLRHVAHFRDGVEPTARLPCKPSVASNADDVRLAPLRGSY